MSIDLSGAFVKPVPEKDDVFAFQYDFLLEGKALEDGSDASTISEEENGDLIIEGWAADFTGLDRQDENFIEGAFQRGVKAFLGSQAALCFHHKRDHGIGKVLDLQEKTEGDKSGLWMKARVDYQPESSPMRYIYNAVKKGTYNGLSVGGYFKRKLTEAGRKICDVDLTEISITPVPVHPGTSFAVLAGKALEDANIPDGMQLPSVPDTIRQEDEEQIKWMLESLGRIFDRISARGDGEAPASNSVILD